MYCAAYKKMDDVQEVNYFTIIDYVTLYQSSTVEALSFLILSITNLKRQAN